MAETYDYTLVLSGGKAYKNTVGGETVSLEGLSYADGVWTMSDFNFTTTATTALQIAEGATTTITVTGENSITAGEASGWEWSYGARFADNTRLLGDGSLTITAGDVERTTSIGIQNDQDLLIEGITLTVSPSTAGSRSGLVSDGGTLTVEDATVSLTNSASMRLGSTVNAIVNGTGKITTGYVVGTIEPQAVAKDVDGNDLTWNGSTYEKADGSTAYEVVLTAKDPDYTIVLKGGTAFKSTDNGATCAEVITVEGLTYNADTGWTMDNFTFTTTASIALILRDQDTTITVIGANAVTSGNGGEYGEYEFYKTALLCDVDSYDWEIGSNLTIKGAETGTNTITFQTPDTAVSYASTFGIQVAGGSSTPEAGVLSIEGNVTVTAIGGNSTNDGSSRGIEAESLSISGTGKLIAQAGENSSQGAKAVFLEDEPDVVAKNTVEGTTPVWSDDDGTYKNGSTAATNLTLTATDVPTDPDYTLVLSGGKAYKNTESGEDITTEVAAMGLTYDRDCGWTMEDFNFTTTATVAVQIAGTDATTITVTGSNSITGGDTTASTTVSGLSVNAVTNLQGTGSLTVNSGKSLNELSEGIAVGKDLTVQGITLTVNSGDSLYSYGMIIYDYYNPTLTVTDATVNLNGGNVSSADGDSIGLLIGGDTNVIVNGTGKITAAAGSASTAWGVIGSNEPQAAAYDASGAELTWSKGTYNDASGNVAATVVLTAKSEPPTPTSTCSISNYNNTAKSDIVQIGSDNLVYVLRDTASGYAQTQAVNDVTGWSVVETRRDLTGDGLADIQITSDDGQGSIWVASLVNGFDGTDVKLDYQFTGAYDNGLWSYLGSADVNADGKSEVLMIQTDAGADAYGHRNVAAWVTNEKGQWVDNEWVGALEANWEVAGTANVTGSGADNVLLRRADGMIGFWNGAGSNELVEVWNAGESRMLTSGDFNADGADDLLFDNADGDFFTWSNIGGELSDVKIGNISDLNGDWDFAGTGDYNGDGKDEILWCDGTNTAYSEANKENFSKLVQIA